MVEEAKCSLLKAYKLEDFAVEEWLTELWQSKLNSKFKQLLNQVPVIERTKALLAGQYTELLAEKEAEASKAQELG